MFREICNLEDVIRAVALERILFEHIPEYGGDFIDGDQFYFQANEIVLTLAQFGYYLDHTESTLYFFKFDEMDTFYNLCKEHSRRNKVNFKKDPYVKAAHSPITYVGANFLGLRRRGFSNEEIKQIQDIFRVLFQDGHSYSTACEIVMAQFPESEIRDQVVSFIRESKRGILKPYNTSAVADSE